MVPSYLWLWRWGSIGRRFPPPELRTFSPHLAVCAAILSPNIRCHDRSNLVGAIAFFAQMERQRNSARRSLSLDSIRMQRNHAYRLILGTLPDQMRLNPRQLIGMLLQDSHDLADGPGVLIQVGVRRGHHHFRLDAGQSGALYRHDAV